MPSTSINIHDAALQATLRSSVSGDAVLIIAWVIELVTAFLHGQLTNNVISTLSLSLLSIDAVPRNDHLLVRLLVT